MKKLVCLFFIVMLFGACNSKDVSVIKNGQKAEQVTAIIGKPDDVIKMPFGIEWWKYGKNQMIIIQNGEVVNVVPDVKKMGEEMGKAMDNMNNAFDQGAEESMQFDTNAVSMPIDTGY